MTDFTPTPEPRDLIHVIHLRGFREPWNAGPSRVFLDALDQQRFLPVLVPVGMDYGQPVPFADSNAFARARALEQIRMAPGPVVLSGYSAGSYVMGDLARDIAFGHVDGVMASDIAAVALIADPKRPEGEGAPGIPTPPGYGIAGERRIPDLPVFWGSASRDAVCALPADNPLRSAADLSKAFSTDPRLWEGWVRDMFDTLVRKELQPWWKFWNRPGRWGEAIAALNGYLTTAHTVDYSREGVCVSLAAAVNNEVAS